MDGIGTASFRCDRRAVCLPGATATCIAAGMRQHKSGHYWATVPRGAEPKPLLTRSLAAGLRRHISWQGSPSRACGRRAGADPARDYRSAARAELEGFQTCTSCSALMPRASASRRRLEGRYYALTPGLRHGVALRHPIHRNRKSLASGQRASGSRRHREASLSNFIPDSFPFYELSAAPGSRPREGSR